MILLCHRFDNKGRRRKRENPQKKKEKKKKKLISRATHSHKPTKFHENKNIKLKSRATHSHKLTKFHEQLKRIEREQYTEIKESKKHVLITSKKFADIEYDGLD